MTDIAIFDAPRTEPAYLHRQLPVVMASDRGLARFLRGLDEMASALYERTGQKEFLFDVGVAPPSIVRLLADQIGVAIDPLLDDAEQRAIARSAAANFPRRGTRLALERALQVLTGDEVAVHDPGGIVVDGAPRIASPKGLVAGAEEDAVGEGSGGAEPSAESEQGGGRGGGSGDAADRALVRIEIGGTGRATSAAVRATVRRELQSGVRFEFDPALPDERSEPA